MQAIAERADVLALPLFLYDHSGITMNTTGFSCPWDSGQVGIIYVDYATIRKEYGDGRGRAWTAKKEKARRCLLAEVSTYDDYLRGNVYGYIVEDEAGQHKESCWGFIGDYDRDGGALVEARAIVKALTHEGKTDASGQFLFDFMHAPAA